MPRPDGAEYMEWAKRVPQRARYSLADSGAPPVTRAELGLSLEDLELSGSNEYGDLGLRERLAAPHGLSPENCLLAEGTSMANVLLSGALLVPGDRVMVERPGYEPLLRVAELFEADPVDLPRRFEDAFQPDEDALERELKRGVRAVWLTNLHNPSGALLSRETLARIYARVERAGAWLVVDEVYREFAPGVPSATELGPRAFVTSSLTKVMGLGGVRIGWALGDARVLDRARKLHGIYSAQTSYPSVCVARVALGRLDWLIERGRRIAAAGRARLDAWLAQHPEIQEVRPPGGLVSFPRLPRGVDDEALAERLLREHETAVVPGRFFHGPGHLRIGIGAPPEVLDEGLRRVGAALSEEEPTRSL